MEKLQLSPEMERLIAENTALKKENADLRENIQILSGLVDDYDKEVNNTVSMLEQTTEKLREATGIIERFTVADDQVDSGLD